MEPNDTNVIRSDQFLGQYSLLWHFTQFLKTVSYHCYGYARMRPHYPTQLNQLEWVKYLNNKTQLITSMWLQNAIALSTDTICAGLNHLPVLFTLKVHMIMIRDSRRIERLQLGPPDCTLWKSMASEESHYHAPQVSSRPPREDRRLHQNNPYQL